MKNMTKKGLIAGIFAWFLLAGLAVSQTECISLSNCGVGQLLGLKATGLVLIAPAYVVALLFSKIFNNK